MNIRTGIGYDVHQLMEGEEFWLGGIRIPHAKGATGHSDADVLLHVICDALLGAASMRDIGYHFSDKDMKYKGIDSKVLLRNVMDMIKKEGYQVGNVDSVVCLQEPRIGKYTESMRNKISEVMGLKPDQISIKATTTEMLGFVGREEGVAAFATVLIYK
jgi:2-C-methyl-D-erythritol 2,4-cyclodiphosphate synthase